MSIFEAILLGLVQGLTEFIPVSSSGHLLLMHHWLGVSEAGLGFDVALHIGTIVALLSVFYKDIYTLVRDLCMGGPRQRLAIILAIATGPAVAAGLLLQNLAETTFRSPFLVAITLASVAVVMLVAEKYAASRPQRTPLAKVSLRQGLLVGCAQAIALIPGISRSGSTIVGGLFAGLDRVAATRFSFLLSLPITLGAIIKMLSDNDTMNQITNSPEVFAAGITAAGLSGWVAIRFLLKFVAKHSLKTFAYYRLALAAVVVLLLLGF